MSCRVLENKLVRKVLINDVNVPGFTYQFDVDIKGYPVIAHCYHVMLLEI